MAYCSDDVVLCVGCGWVNRRDGMVWDGYGVFWRCVCDGGGGEGGE